MNARPQPPRDYHEEVHELELALENALIGVSRRDREGRFTLVRAEYARMLGYDDPRELEGRTWDVTIVPEDVPGALESYSEMLETGRSARELRAIRRDGSHRWMNLLLVKAYDESGEWNGHFGFMRDVSAERTEREEHGRAEEALRIRERALAAATNGVLITDASQPDNPVIYANDAAVRITGYPREELLGEDCRFLRSTDRVQPGFELLRNSIAAGSPCKVVLRNHRKDGTPFWLELAMSPVNDAQGHVTQFVGILTDITQRIEDEQRMKLMVAELDHRVKNNLATVISLAEQTALSAHSIAGFQERFAGRLMALARNHETLAARHWAGVLLHEALERLLSPHDEARQRIDLVGPPVLLPPAVSSPLCLALHELATNAQRHGALDTPGGRVEISWNTRGMAIAGDRLLNLRWREWGGPEVVPGPKTGLGMRLVKGLIEYELDGRVRVSPAADGVVAEIEIPLTGTAIEDPAARWGLAML